MTDFLDMLIGRHMDAAPQIVPRLPSIFEPEIPRCGLNVAVPDNNVPEIEETISGPSVRTKTIPPSHVERMDPPPVAQVAIPTASSPATVKSVQPKAMRAPTVPAREETRSVKTGMNESVFSVAPRERAGVREANSTSDSPTLPLSKRERGLNKAFATSSAIPGAPAMGMVRRAHQEEYMERTPPNPQTTPVEQPPVKEGINKPVFSLSSGERAGGLAQGRLKPSVGMIAPAIPSVSGPERSTSQPEPVINVTIGRIEVRATVSPQKQTPKPENRPPVMGLEEYLRRRSGGHDR